jgi:hypothetical protein
MSAVGVRCRGVAGYFLFACEIKGVARANVKPLRPKPFEIKGL